MSNADLHLEYRDCQAGWIVIDISSHEQAVRVHASQVFDPFPALITWLESIVTGASVSEFEIDEEGSLVALQFTQGDRQGIFTLTDPLEDRLLLQMSILPKTLVAEFYAKLRAFAVSQAYRKEEWEIETLGERLSFSMEGIAEDVILDQLLAYPVRAIQQLFWKVAPSYEIVFPNAFSAQERLRYFADYVTDDEHPLDGAIQVPDLYPFPQGFDELPEDERRRYLQECLTDRVSGYCGVKLGELRSPLIEKWLQEQEDAE